MVVDLPEPDGPQSTMRSPWVTLRSMSLSTWNWPNHLFTPCIWMTGSPERSGCSGCRDVSFMVLLLRPVTGVELAFQMHGITRHAETEQPINQRGEYVALGRHAQPGRVARGALDAVEEVEQADDDHQAGVLEQCDEGVDDARNDHLQRLRQ